MAIGTLSLGMVGQWIISMLILFIVSLLLPKVKTYLPLCMPCSKTDCKGRMIRFLSWYGLGISIFAFWLLGMSQFEEGGQALSISLGLMLGIGIVLIAYQETRRSVIRVKRIKEDTMTLKASPHWKTILSNEYLLS